MAEMIDKTQSPAALVSVARAAHRTNDRDLERAAKRLLLEEYGIRIIFQRDRPVTAEKPSRQSATPSTSPRPNKCPV